jgi:hypothetical protein
LPQALREVTGLHDGWRSGMDRFEGASQLTSLRLHREGREADFQERNGGRLPTVFVRITDNGSGDGEVLDLEALDGRGDPMVRGFDHGTWEVGSHATPFWTWFEQEMPEAFLRHNRDGGWTFWGAAYGPEP